VVTILRGGAVRVLGSYLPFYSDDLCSHTVPKQIGLTHPPQNPALPAKPRKITPSRYRPPADVITIDTDTDTLGVGPRRVYLDIQSAPPNVAYPPRPVPGSVADMDVVMDHCDFSTSKVRPAPAHCTAFKFTCALSTSVIVWKYYD